MILKLLVVMYKIIQKKNITNKRNKNNLIFTKYIINLEQTYNIDKKNIIKDFSNYILRTYPQIISQNFLSTLENIIHFEDCDNNYYINYYFYKVIDYLLEI